MMMQGEGGNGGGMNMCKCPHHKMIPMLIFVIGLLFFLNAVGVVTANALAILWPIAVMLAGLMKMMKGKCKCCAMP